MSKVRFRAPLLAIAFTLALSAIALTTTVIAAQTQTPGQPPQTGQQPPAGMPPNGGPPPDNWKPEKLTNLKVLPKDTTPDQIIVIMRHYTRSLGVGCLGCHKGQQGQPLSTFDFADDSKENKEITRGMIKMTQDINTKYPDAFPERNDGDKDKPRVTCATCHRRNRHPETDPPPPPPRPGEPTQIMPGAPGAPGAPNAPQAPAPAPAPTRPPAF
jgi:hypothetical protein